MSSPLRGRCRSAGPLFYVPTEGSGRVFGGAQALSAAPLPPARRWAASGSLIGKMQSLLAHSETNARNFGQEVFHLNGVLAELDSRLASPDFSIDLKVVSWPRHQQIVGIAGQKQCQVLSGNIVKVGWGLLVGRDSYNVGRSERV